MSRKITLAEIKHIVALYPNDAPREIASIINDIHPDAVTDAQQDDVINFAKRYGLELKK